MKKWNELPLDMQVEDVKKYYKILEKFFDKLAELKEACYNDDESIKEKVQKLVPTYRIKK